MSWTVDVDPRRDRHLPVRYGRLYFEGKSASITVFYSRWDICVCPEGSEAEDWLDADDARREKVFDEIREQLGMPEIKVACRPNGDRGPSH